VYYWWTTAVSARRTSMRCGGGWPRGTARQPLVGGVRARRDAPGPRRRAGGPRALDDFTARVVRALPAVFSARSAGGAMSVLEQLALAGRPAAHAARAACARLWAPWLLLARCSSPCCSRSRASRIRCWPGRWRRWCARSRASRRCTTRASSGRCRTCRAARTWWWACCRRVGHRLEHLALRRPLAPERGRPTGGLGGDRPRFPTLVLALLPCSCWCCSSPRRSRARSPARAAWCSGWLPRDPRRRVALQRSSCTCRPVVLERPGCGARSPRCRGRGPVVCGRRSCCVRWSWWCCCPSAGWGSAATCWWTADPGARGLGRGAAGAGRARALVPAGRQLHAGLPRCGGRRVREER